MTATATPPSSSISREVSARAAPRTLVALNRLLDLPVSELERMYEGARTPAIADVRGDLRGRMLAWPVLEKRPGLQGLFRAFAGSKAFPWRGKSFRMHDTARGEGINRIIEDRWKLFRFDTFIGKSRQGDFDALQLDYDLPGNPPIIRSIKDEIRTVEPGVWLGQAWFVSERTKFLWLYFGLAAADG
jgi:hypothetical protein